MSRIKRVELLRELEALRGTRVLTYVCATRRGDLPNDIRYETIRPLHQHLKKMGRVPRLDLLIVSRGGDAEIPWRVVTLLREYCDTLGVLVPYRAHSGATMIALGADEIVMGPLGELGPIDAALPITRYEGNVRVDELVRAEDAFAVASFLRDRVGITEGQSLAKAIAATLERVPPWTLGRLERARSHVVMTATKLLHSHVAPMAEERIKQIVSALAEEVPDHNYRVARREAQQLGLQLAPSNTQIEAVMERLMQYYEAEMEMHVPFDPDSLLGIERDNLTQDVTLSVIDSAEATSVLRSSLHIWRTRQFTSPLAINWIPVPAPLANIPVVISVEGLPPALAAQAQTIGMLYEGLKQTLEKSVLEQARRMAPVIKTEVRWLDVKWHDATERTGT